MAMKRADKPVKNYDKIQEIMKNISDFLKSNWFSETKSEIIKKKI